MLCCIAAADAAIRKSLRAEVVLQVIILVEQHPQSSLEWLACLNKVRMKRMLVLQFCT